MFVGVAAAPFLGANVGVAIWGTTGFAVAWLLLSGRAVTARSVVSHRAARRARHRGVLGVDLFGGGEQTHLGRALTGAEQGGLGTLWTIVARKADANARVLAVHGSHVDSRGGRRACGLRALASGQRLAGLLAENPQLRQGRHRRVVAGVLAFFSEDSGIVIPSLIALYVGVALAWLMVARLCRACGR